MNVHTDANAVPPVDGTDLGDTLAVLDGWHAAITMMRDAGRLLATDRLTLEMTQDITVAMAGMADDTDVLSMFRLLFARITNPDTNPCLRQLTFEQQKKVQQAGEALAFQLGDPNLHQHAADASAAIHTD